MPAKRLTIGQQLIQQGVERGFLEGQRTMFRRQLRSRFGGQVDGGVVWRIEDASAEQLARWAERVLSAGTMAEVLED